MSKLLCEKYIKYGELTYNLSIRVVHLTSKKKINNSMPFNVSGVTSNEQTHSFSTYDGRIIYSLSRKTSYRYLPCPKC